MTLEQKIEEAIHKRYSDAGRKGGKSRSAKKLAHLARLNALNDARRAMKKK